MNGSTEPLKAEIVRLIKDHYHSLDKFDLLERISEIGEELIEDAEVELTNLCNEDDEEYDYEDECDYDDEDEDEDDDDALDRDGW